MTLERRRWNLYGMSLAGAKKTSCLLFMNLIKAENNSINEIWKLIVKRIDGHVLFPSVRPLPCLLPDVVFFCWIVYRGNNFYIKSLYWHYSLLNLHLSSTLINRPSLLCKLKKKHHQLLYFIFAHIAGYSYGFPRTNVKVYVK